MHKLTPSEGQSLAIDFALRNKYAIFPMKPGQGKTLCAVESCLRLGGKTLVICPGYARNEWFNGFIRQDPLLDIEVFKKKSDIEIINCEVKVISYEMLYDTRNKKDPCHQSSQLFKWADNVCFDEAHYLKNTDSKRGYYAHKLTYEYRPKMLLLLSGTPAKNRLYELYSLIALCKYKHDQDIFLRRFPTWTDFANYFCKAFQKRIKTKWGYINKIEYKGTRNLDDLRPYLSDCYFRMPKHLRFKMPAKIDKFVTIDKIPKLEGLMESFLDFTSGKKGTTPDIKAKAAAISAPFSAKLAKELKETHGQICVFSDHVESCEVIAQKLRVKPIHGGVTITKRLEILEDFRSGKTDYIVATIGTLSTAISMTNTNVMVINDPPWVPGDLEQTEGRIRRKGQDDTCFYYKVLVTPQAEKIYKVLESKNRDLSAIGS